MNRVYNFVAARGNGGLKLRGSWIAIAALAAVSAAPAAATTQLRFTLTGDADATWTLPEVSPFVNIGFGFLVQDVPIKFEGVQQTVTLRWDSFGGNSGAFSIIGANSFELFAGFGTTFFTGAQGGVKFLPGTYVFSSDDFFIPGNGTLNIAVAPQGVIPEPATWGLLIAGFGLVGAAARRRRTATTHA